MQKEIYILDSNIWISYVITKRLSDLVALVQDHQLAVITCHTLVAEIQDVLSRPKFKKYIRISDIKGKPQFLSLVTRNCSGRQVN